MMRRILMLALALGWGTPALTHHGWSGYDSSTPLTLTGVIKRSSYEHPHAFIELEALGKAWRVILAPPSRMSNRGLPASALTPGTPVTVEGYPHRSDPQEMRAERITVGGKTTELR